ncbi:MAG: hypothetical protein FWG22_04770 [Prolixibacteraceae bacterium]|nr:hypothetical protein [Prolixibacteraceae bacterium]
MGLFSKWNSDNVSTALTAIEKLTNQVKLARAAQKAKEQQVRQAAVNKLTDQNILANIAKNNKYDDYERIIAADRLTDQTLAQKVYTDIAKNNKSIIAADRLTDKTLAQKVFADVAKNNKDWIVRGGAVERLTDQNVLADIAKKDENNNVRIEAFVKMTDQTLVQEIVSDLRDKVLLERIWLGNKDIPPAVRNAARTQLDKIQAQEDERSKYYTNRCPKCGKEKLTGRNVVDRTSRTGLFYVVYCNNCSYKKQTVIPNPRND